MMSQWLIKPPSTAEGGSPLQKKPQRIAREAAQRDPNQFASLMQGGMQSGLPAGMQASLPGGLGSAAQAGGKMASSIASLTQPGTLQLRSPVLAGRAPSDLARTQIFNKAQTDMRQTQAMEGLMQSVAGGDSPLSAARSIGVAKHLRSMSGFGQNLKGLDASDYIRTNRAPAPRKSRLQEKDLPQSPAAPAPVQQQVAKKDDMPKSEGIGQLSARFESGSDGIAAVGYDSTGGTSYGKFQIASRVGSMKRFIEFLDTEAPDIAQRLRKAGPANTGSRRGAMPQTWKQIAAEQPERFEALQEAFIGDSHYKPALKSIVERTGLEEKSLSPAMREVIWSTAVQHGPAGAARIFSRADGMSGKATDPGYERKMISNVYKLRAGQFGSSNSSVQAAVQSRFKQEKMLALNMLDSSRTTALA